MECLLDFALFFSSSMVSEIQAHFSQKAWERGGVNPEANLTEATCDRRSHNLGNSQTRNNSAHKSNGGGESISEGTFPSSLKNKGREGGQMILHL